VSIAQFLHGLASFARVIVFDKRGVGMSDPAATTPTLEERMEDVRAVMDAAGSERAALFGTSEGGPLGVLFAATYPQRTLALILFSTYARTRRSEDYPIGVTDRFLAAAVAEVGQDWGGDTVLDFIVPSIGSDWRARERWRRYFRRSTSPGAAQAQLRMNYDTDVRHLLGAVQTPTLVLHGAREQWIRANHGRYLAKHIAGARYVDIDSADHLPFLECGDTVVEETREFLTGVREPAEPDRVLATVLFTDIESSTKQAAELGDRRWREMLDAHDTTVRRQLDRYRGREIKTHRRRVPRHLRRTSAGDPERMGDLRRHPCHRRRRPGRTPHRRDRTATRRHRKRRRACSPARLRARRPGRGTGLGGRPAARRRIRNRVPGPRRTQTQGNPRHLASLRRKRLTRSTTRSGPALPPTARLLTLSHA
jgi:pimeloyl-ACP methyl ester carboxylesterase